MGGGSMMGSAYLWAWLILILLAAAVASLVAMVVLTSRARRTDPPVQPGEEAREILRRRYAAGEIDEDEYTRRLSGLAQR